MRNANCKLVKQQSCISSNILLFYLKVKCAYHKQLQSLASSWDVNFECDFLKFFVDVGNNKRIIWFFLVDVKISLNSMKISYIFLKLQISNMIAFDHVQIQNSLVMETYQLKTIKNLSYYFLTNYTTKLNKYAEVNFQLIEKFPSENPKKFI